jgi:hypothetical protein
MHYTLHSGDVAAITGRIDIAREMFNAVLTEHPQPIYAYYALRARTRLIQLEKELLQSFIPQSS